MQDPTPLDRSSADIINQTGRAFLVCLDVPSESLLIQFSRWPLQIHECIDSYIGK